MLLLRDRDGLGNFLDLLQLTINLRRADANTAGENSAAMRSSVSRVLATRAVMSFMRAPQIP